MGEGTLPHQHPHPFLDPRLEVSERCSLGHSLPGPGQEQAVIEEVQVDGAGVEFPLGAQSVVVQCHQLTTLHQPP